VKLFEPLLSISVFNLLTLVVFAITITFVTSFGRSLYYAMRLITFSTVVLSHIAYVTAVPTTWEVGQQVITTSGLVTGHASKKVAEVSEYLGIQFAQAPIGALRFMPPVAFTSKNAIKADDYVSNFQIFGELWLKQLLGSGMPIPIASREGIDSPRRARQ
jgi:Carboxylesterase family